MKLNSLIFKSFWHFRKSNLTVAFGMAIGIAVITGALVTGDSVRSGLQKLVSIRLGQVDLAISAGDRYVTDSLALRLSDDLNVPVAAVLQLEGSATAGGGVARLPKVQIFGIDDHFSAVAGPGTFEIPMVEGQAVISDNLAARLNVAEGDEILLRINNPGPIPIDAPFVSSEENIVTTRLTVAAIAGKDEHGRFHLHNTQTAPFNIFISRQQLQKLAGLDGFSNLILLAGNGRLTAGRVSASLAEQWRLEDAGLHLEKHPVTGELVIRTPRVFFDGPTIEAISAVPTEKDFRFTYFVNELRSGSRSAPYSFVSTLPGSRIKPDEIVVNQWLADDLGITTGDSVSLSYFLVGPLRTLTVGNESFLVSGIIAMDDPECDRLLMPEIPGLSDAGDCRDWETSIPIDLEKIRDHDESYWNSYRGTPKAFINPEVAVRLWENRFGRHTQVRFAPGTDPAMTGNAILSALSPEDQGIRITEPSRVGMEAASTGVDFSGLFLSLSFFLIAGGIILTILLIRLGLDGRRSQVGTLRAMGWPEQQINRALLGENILVSLLGALFGLILTWVYTYLVFKALSGVWNAIILTDTLRPVYQPGTLALGILSGLVVAVGSAWLALRRFFRNKTITLLQKTRENPTGFAGRLLKSAAFTAGFASLALLIYGLTGIHSVNPMIFFGAGTLLLAGILLQVIWMFRVHHPEPYQRFGLTAFSRGNLWRNRNRSLSVILLFAIGMFLVVAIGANRKSPARPGDPGSPAARQKSAFSGTGGFTFFMETTVPVPDNLNNPLVRGTYGLEEEVNYLQMKRLDGDDASCLNLNRVSNPPVLGVPTGGLSGRFRLASRMAKNGSDDPWPLLDQELPGGAIPVLADQTVIQWGLMMKVGDTLHYQAENGTAVDLVLVGGLANSLFQGYILISEEQFIRLWPSTSGTNVFLIDAGPVSPDLVQTDLGRVFRDYGAELILASKKLAGFSSVTNTYLSIFLVMGALAMLLGTVGLAVVLARSLQERSAEMALLRAVGFSRRRILQLIISEYSTLLLAGTLAGGIPAFLSVLPGLVNPAGEVPLLFLTLIILILVAHGLVWILGLGWLAVSKSGITQRLRND